tara:strand:+ start:51 stop:341 length:291 start_codon:yes stop_codon:yes gene_type:complete
MTDQQIVQNIKTVFPKAIFIESDDYLVEDNSVDINDKVSISWMPQDESLFSDIYEADSYFGVTLEITNEEFLCSDHSSLDKAIEKVMEHITKKGAK